MSDVPAQAARIRLEIEGIPAAAARVRLQHYRIDDRQQQLVLDVAQPGFPHRTLRRISMRGLNPPGNCSC